MNNELKIPLCETLCSLCLCAEKNSVLKKTENRKLKTEN